MLPNRKMILAGAEYPETLKGEPNIRKLSRKYFGRRRQAAAEEQGACRGVFVPKNSPTEISAVPKYSPTDLFLEGSSPRAGI